MLKFISTINVYREEVNMENDEVEMIDDRVHVENDGSQHEGSNVERASEDNAIEEENNAQRQKHAESTLRQRRMTWNLNDYVTNSEGEEEDKLHNLGVL